MLIVLIEIQFLKVAYPIDLSWLMMSPKTSFSIKNTSSNDLQLLYASLPINFTDSGIVIFVNEVHSENAFHQYNLPQKL